MGPSEVALILFGVFALLVIVRVPVAFALGLACVPVFYIDDRLTPFLLLNEMLKSYNSFLLLSIPFFMLAANLMNTAGITDKLINLSRVLVGWMPGGLGHVSVLVSMLFAGISGSSAADVAVQQWDNAPARRGREPVDTVEPLIGMEATRSIQVGDSVALDDVRSPLLVKRGFRGPIYCTPATADLLRVLLLDAAHLQEEDAARANRYRYSKHSPALPLYTVADAEAVLEQLEPRGYEHPFAVVDGVEARLRRAGHILGSATVELLLGDGSGARLVYSGDLGRRARPILRDPEPVPSADILLVESTYGDREHAGDAREQLARVVLEAVDRGGALSAAAGLVSTIHEQLRWRVSAASDGECVVL